MKAKIIIGANLGDEGKGTVVANYVKQSNEKVLNILTNGGSQRAHSILTKDGSFTFQHFGSGTYYGSDNYFSQYFILNPIQFVKEYYELIERNVKIDKIYRHPWCRWSTPFDMMANQIIEELRDYNKHGSCGMGIWETVLRYKNTFAIPFSTFVNLDYSERINYLLAIKKYFEKRIGNIPDKWVTIWNSDMLLKHFINDCNAVYNLTIESDNPNTYNEFIFENGQGLMLNDNGIDEMGKTPSKTDSTYALLIAKQMGIDDISLHYVTRPYLTRHGRGNLENETSRILLSVPECRTNHYNEFQEHFRYAPLDIESLQIRIKEDNKQQLKTVIELTHCDEMDRLADFKKVFDTVNTYDSPLI